MKFFSVTLTMRTVFASDFCKVSVIFVQSEIVAKVVADLTDQIKDHPLDVKSLEYKSKLTVKLSLLCAAIISITFCIIVCRSKLSTTSAYMVIV